MFDKWLNLPAHLYLRITALTILTVGIALSNVLMSIGTIWIISNWLIQADFKSYAEKLKQKKTVWFIIFIYALLAVSLFWSTDVSYGFKDLRIKLPFIVIPLVLATSEPIERKHFFFLLYVFIGIVAYTSVYNIIRYNFYLDDSTDIRQMSTFISHVRFSVLINLGIFTSVYLIYQKKGPWLLWILTIGWFLFYLYKSQIINGYLLFAILVIYSTFYFISVIKDKKWRRLAYGFIALGATGIILLSINTINKIKVVELVNYDELELFTANNNPYYHDTSSVETENGNYVWHYVNQDEMKREWAKRSLIDYDSVDLKGQPMYGTLMRFLTSKNEPKDSLGVWSLSDHEVKLIENGQTSIVVNKGLITRLNTFVFEFANYQKGGDPNGHSFSQRVEHLKAACNLIKKNPWKGVGVGDIELAFTNEYARMNSRLLPENQHRSHNQYLTIWVGLGIIGVLAFILSLFWPFIELKKSDYFSVIVLVSLIVSCLFQDFIETQAGVTIFALMYSLAIYRTQDEKA